MDRAPPVESLVPFCTCSQEALLDKYTGLDVESNCPLCLRANLAVPIGFHRSSDAAAAAAAAAAVAGRAASSVDATPRGAMVISQAADLSAIASANAIWRHIQQEVSDVSAEYSDPCHRMELPFPFPGVKPSDRFDLHVPSAQGADTFTYMGRQRFAQLLDQLPIPPAVRTSLWLETTTDAAAVEVGLSTAVSSSTASAVPSAASAAPAASRPPPSDFFPPIPADAAARPVVMFLYGTIGYGKSHLLAAMVCFLVRKGRRVVYLPDCKIMLGDPVVYFRSALLLTFAADPRVQQQVARLSDPESVVQFCKAHPELTYVIDQFNALEQDMAKDSTETLALKAHASRMISRATFDCAVVKAASANNLTARVVHDKQLNMNIQTLFGGMNAAEMRQWYRHSRCLLDEAASSSVADACTMDDSATAASSPSGTERAAAAGDFDADGDALADMRRRVEDSTGCIPLYLKCFVDCTSATFQEVWRTKFAAEKRVRRVYDHLLEFHRDLKKREDQSGWRFHMEVLRSFLLGGMPHTSDYDHRYLYEDDADGRGHIACGLARDCLISVLRLLDGDMHFVEGAFLSNIKTTRNPSMRGFLIEQACLSYIRHSGLLLPSPHGLMKPDRVVYFDAGAEETARVLSPCVLYIPRPFNYRAVDAIIRVLQYGRTESSGEAVVRVILVPIQITLSASHKPSPASFYPRHQVWLSDIDAHVPREHVFVWLRRDPEDRVDHVEHQRGTREQSIITPAFSEVTVTFATLSRDLHICTSPPRRTPPRGRSDAPYDAIPFALSGDAVAALGHSASASDMDTSGAADRTVAASDDAASRVHGDPAATSSTLSQSIEGPTTKKRKQ